MGLIKAVLGAAGGFLADQWREYFYCEALDANTLVTKGVHRTGKRSSNTKGSDNVISNGSIVAVNEGQCMIIVDQGKITEF
ncbi:MAG: SPFH domain-containing protein, partial [Clostridia bacterium]|nr:SPFH domain-containing protein [Clostridia bacterium]